MLRAATLAKLCVCCLFQGAMEVAQSITNTLIISAMNPSHIMGTQHPKYACIPSYWKLPQKPQSEVPHSQNSYTYWLQVWPCYS